MFRILNVMRERERVMEEVATSRLLVLPAAAAFREVHKECVSGQAALRSSLSAREEKLICVTGGNSYLGSHIVKELLAHGYLVRVIIQNQEDFEDLKKLMGDEELNLLESVVIAKMGNLESLCNAFRGCHAIFHTSFFIDPHGISGYSEQMAFLEGEGARNVIEACGRMAYMKRCIFTSSLLASIWRHDTGEAVVDESCWSDEEFCRENKLWLALGKTRAEKSAWRKASELKVNLLVLCPGLLMASSFPNVHTESSLPYLKGGQMMLKRGVLAVGDVKKVAEAHVHVYEAMDHGACGRYLCFEKVIQSREDAIELENGLKVQGLLLGGRRNELSSSQETYHHEEILCNVSNARLATLILQASKRISCKE